MTKPSLLPKEELQKFVRDYLAGDIFTHQMIHNPNDIGMVFMPLTFGAVTDWTKEEIDDIGCVYARYSDGTFPMSVNGYPIFKSCGFLHKDDWGRAVVAIRREQARLKDIEV